MTKLAEVFKALGDDTRLKIIRILVDREMRVCEIVDRINISQPAVSQHLKILRQAGLIFDTRVGQWVHYRINIEALNIITEYVVQIKSELKSDHK